MNKQNVLIFTFLFAASNGLLLSQESESSFFDDTMADQKVLSSTDESGKDEAVKYDAQATEKKEIEKNSEDEKSVNNDEVIEAKKPVKRHDRIGFGRKGLQEAARASRRSTVRKNLDDIKPEERKRKYARRSGYSGKRDKELSSRMKKVGERNARMQRRAKNADKGERATSRKPIAHEGRIKNPREGRVGRRSVSHDETFEPTHLDRSARRATPAFLKKREAAREKQEEKKSASQEDVVSKEPETFEE
jgi:hypothetical protein